jgi:hypothetical protein
MVSSEMVGWLNVVQMAFIKAADEGDSTTDSESFGRHVKCSQSPGLRNCETKNLRAKK